MTRTCDNCCQECLHRGHEMTVECDEWVSLSQMKQLSIQKPWNPVSCRLHGSFRGDSCPECKGGTMEKEQIQDLKHQRPEETDNIQKSERPARDYCEDRGIDPETQGKKKDEIIQK